MFAMDKRDREKLWRQQNPDKYNEAIRRWKEANPDKVKEASRRYYQTHKEQVDNQNKQWAAKNKAKLKDWRTANKEYLSTKKRFDKFGISQIDYNALIIKQNGVCGICKKPDSKKALAVDHDHKSGRIRGLLCGKCNMAIGLFDDSAELLQSALTYIEEN